MGNPLYAESPVDSKRGHANPGYEDQVFNRKGSGLASQTITAPFALEVSPEELRKRSVEAEREKRPWKMATVALAVIAIILLVGRWQCHGRLLLLTSRVSHPVCHHLSRLPVLSSL